MMRFEFYGKAARELSKEYELDCSSIEDGFKALNIITEGGFFKFLNKIAEEKSPYSFFIDEEKLTKKNIYILKGPSKGVVVRAIPSVEGEGVDPWSLLIYAIISLVVGVILNLIFAPSMSSQDDEKRSSYIFSGGPRPLKQGGIVPVGYGLVMAPGRPVAVIYDYAKPSSSVGGGWGDGRIEEESKARIQ